MTTNQGFWGWNSAAGANAETFVDAQMQNPEFATAWWIGVLREAIRENPDEVLRELGLEPVMLSFSDGRIEESGWWVLREDNRP